MHKSPSRPSPPRSTEYSKLEEKLKGQCAIPICLPIDFLKAATSDFSEEQELGRGGFGVVYKGVLQNGIVIAVKKLSGITNLDDDQFQKEVTNLFGLKHKNIVQLVGYCAESHLEVVEIGGKYVMAEVRKRLICFEYINNQSLDKHLPAESHGLEWHMRYEIVKGICHGLHYLHTECQIVHLDIKPQNILLDDNMEPKITDFGMSRLFGPQQSRIITQNTGGTHGYMAPEYLVNGLISIKADIFSFGVIIIELMTGYRDYPTKEEFYEHFIENVVESWRKKLEEVGRYTPLEKYVEQVKMCTLIALMCVNSEPNKRPTTEDIIEKLTNTDVSTADGGPRGSGDENKINHEPTNRPLLKRFRRLFKTSLFPSLRTKPLSSQPERPQLVHFDGELAFTMEDLLRAEADVLGKGTYGTVYKAMLDTGSILAVKRLRLNMIKDSEQFKAEVAMLGKVQHTNLLAFKAYFKSADEALIIFDYMPKGSHSAMLHARATDARVGWATRMAIAKGTARGLAHLHDDMSIIHGNLTARNVLLDEQSHPKIADFGLFRAMTTVASSNSMLATAHEQGYCAPELSSVTKASTKTDVYSLGIIILEHLTGKPPRAIDMPQLVASVSREEWTGEVFDMELMWDLDDVGGPSQDDLMSTLKLALQCVDRLPSARPTAREVLAELERICPGPENVTGQGQDSSPLQLHAQDELGLAQISEHQPPLQRAEDQEVLANNWAIWSEPEGAQDAFEQQGHNWAVWPEAHAQGAFEQLVVPTETQEVLQEQISSRSGDGARTSGGQLASVQIEGWEAFEQPEHIHGGPQDGTMPSNPWSSFMQPERRDILQPQPPERILSGPDDAAGPSEDELPWYWEEFEQPEQIGSGTEDGAAALEVEQSRPEPEPSAETSEDLTSVPEQREAQAAVLLSGPEYGTGPTDEDPPDLLLPPEDPEVVSEQREHQDHQPEADDDVSGQSDHGSTAHTRPVIFSCLLICLPFLVRE